jgi:hypothetical protein
MMNKNKILVWNCRGAASGAFYRYCKHYLDMTKPDIVVIMETRTEPSKLRRTFELLGFDGFVNSEVRGYAGGIIVAWKQSLVGVQLLVTNFQFIHVKIMYGSQREWFFTAIYASPQEDNRRLLWEDLKRIANGMNTEWLVAGDFNDILYATEKKGGAVASLRKCNLFRDRINNCQLLDLGAIGSKFTWRGPIYNNGCRIYERLDRALCNSNWRLRFPEAIVRVLMRVEFSDHHPLLICPYGSGVHNHAYSFKFESAWLVDDSYNDLVQNSWTENEDMQVNLANLTTNFKDWNYNTFEE